MKQVYNYLFGIKGILLILYMEIVFGSNIYLSSLNESLKTLLYFMLFVVLIAVCPPLLRWVCRLGIRYRPTLNSRKHKVLWYLSFLLASAFVFGLCFAAFYPGGFSADCFNQYEQALSGEYSNWHPVLHTLLGFLFPLTVTGGWVGSMVLFQITAFSFAAAYMAYTVLRHSNIPYAVLSLAFVLLNPVTMFISMYPWKDIPFAITATVLAAYAANTYFTRGEWLRKPAHLAASIGLLSLMTILRHNGLFFTVPVLIGMLLYINRKRALTAAACFLAVIVIVEGPLYALLNVERPGGRLCEAMGLPVGVIGEVAAHRPEVLDEDMKTFIYEVAPEYYWKDYYLTGHFNSIKFYPETDYFRIDEEGAFKVVGYMLRCFFKAPKESFDAVIRLTDINFAVGGEITWENFYPCIISNEDGVVYGGNHDIVTVIDYVTGRLSFYLKWLFWYVGSLNLLLLIAVLAKLRFRRKGEWKRILMVLSMITYNFGTMLLLSGDDFRLFYYSFTVFPVLLLIVMRESVPKTEPPIELPLTEVVPVEEPPAEDLLTEKTES